MHNCRFCHGQSLRKGDRGWWCQTCGLIVPYTYRGYRLTSDDIHLLLSDGKTDYLCSWSRRDTGGLFLGRLRLDDSKVLAFEAKKPKHGICPRCKSQIYESEQTLFCSHCNLEIWKTIAGKALNDKAISQLLLYGKTDPIAGFVQKESGKSFSATLVLSLKDGTISFS